MSPPPIAGHHALEADCERLVAAAFVEDPRALATRWRAIEAELREHMAGEENLVLAAYQTAEAEALRVEHAEIRRLLDEIRAHIDRGIHAERLRRLVAALHAHAAREDTRTDHRSPT
ncbi:MAG TPA: hemerythrin domain-containing protein [Kofleriaceae bacterium]|nr:hemerythrin domain-containing protein [Kofleriaceae bacterium]